ncbi:MFS transporter [candidate division KSB3 bacterium]|uniref:MFS transporter n=1 Tax=candidate division KSB3 bacterium TaxID=2044937 RepID=A0A9D5JU05_9BACT|nr:MFS transporter [candidate division KSB3 bacterium]MBD3324140.1 MFS transporter [candidate division KSB3 bacterium]
MTLMPLQEATLHATDPQKRMNFLAVAWGTNVLAYSIIYPFLPIYFHSIRGIPMSTVGLIYPIMGMAVIVGSPISGVLTDRIGRRLLLVGGPLGRSVAFWAITLMAALHAPFGFFVAGFFLSTLAGEFFRNSANTYLSDISAPEERPIAFSKVRVGLNVGWMLGPAIGSFLADLPFALLFSLTAVLCLVTAGIPYVCCPAVAVPGSENSESHDEGSLLSILRTDRRFILLLVLNLLLYFSVSQFVSTLSIYATKIVGISKTSVGFLYTLNGAMVIGLLIPLNNALRRVPLFLRIGLGALLYVLAYLGFGLSTQWTHLALSMVVMTVGEMTSLTAVVAAVSQMAPRRMMGRYMGLHGLVDGFGWAVGPFFGSLLFESLQSQPFTLWVCLAAGTFVAGCGYLLILIGRHGYLNMPG